MFFTVRQDKHFSCSFTCCFCFQQLIRRCKARVDEVLWHNLFKMRDTAQRSVSACFMVLYQLIKFFITFRSETLMLFFYLPRNLPAAINLLIRKLPVWDTVCYDSDGSWFYCRLYRKMEGYSRTRGRRVMRLQGGRCVKE